LRQTEYVILGLLSESPLTGYQMKQLIDIRFRFFWNESYGQLYPTLKDLRGRGLIEETDSKTPSAARAQKAYRICEAGMEALRQWLQQPVEKETVRLEILLKMYFSNLTDPEVMAEHIKLFQASHERDLQILNMFRTELEAISEVDPNHPHVLRVIDFGQKVNQAYLAWSRETITFLESRYSK
jgi:PadR family transcriptional regulator, regulatory protein AphA